MPEASSKVPALSVATCGDRLETWKIRVPQVAQKKHVVIAPLSLRLSKDARGPSSWRFLRGTGIEMENALALCF